MRVAIVTQELMHNYGGTMQAYAMQEALRRLGHATCDRGLCLQHDTKVAFLCMQEREA